MSSPRRSKDRGSLILGAALGISLGQALAETPPVRPEPGVASAPLESPAPQAESSRPGPGPALRELDDGSGYAGP